MLFWLTQEELSEGVRKVEGIFRKEVISQNLVNQRVVKFLSTSAAK